jgi:hypothetical protein
MFATYVSATAYIIDMIADPISSHWSSTWGVPLVENSNTSSDQPIVLKQAYHE